MAQSEIGELQVLITAQADKFNEEIAKVQNQIKNMSAATGKLSAKTIALGSILGNVATKAFGSLVGVVRSSRQEYENTSASLTKLATVMQQRGATQAQYNEVVKLTEAEEKLGVVSASAMQNGLQELATYVGKAESLKKLTNTMNNLIVQQHGYNANEDQALQTATMMGKVLQGQTGGMERIGYHLDEADKKLFNYGTEEERVALLTSIVNDNLGDMNRRLGETNAGKQIQLANTWSQLRAQIGELATAVGNILIPVFSAIANVVGRAIAYIKAFLKLFGVETGNAAASTASSVSDASEAVSDYGDAAEGAAKKAKKALAAFDEMNVLTEETSSGSGGGGGGVDILGDLEASANAIDWGSLIPDIELPKWLKDLQSLFSDLDFKKITKAFQRFGNDVQKALKPVGKILSDVWNKYLKPFITWAGNEALPAFLNAVGGAIQLIGSVIGSLWDNFLKPFIDNFLVPIAQFTGGIIVSVLNGIGEALRSIANNQTAVDAIVASIVTLVSLIAAAKISTAISGLTSMIPALIGSVSTAVSAFSSAYAAGMTMSSAFGAAATASTGLTSVIAGLGQGLMGFVEAVCSPVGIAILGVAAAITAVVTVVEAFKTAQMLADENTKTYLTTEQLAEQTANNRARAVDSEREAMDELSRAISGVNSANLDLINAEESLRNSTNNLETSARDNNMTTEQAIAWYESLDGNMSALDNKHLALAKSVATYKAAQDKSKAATEALTNATKEQESAEAWLYDAQQRELRALLDEQAQVYASTGDWEGLSNMLVDLAEHEYEFIDAQGNVCKRSKDEMAWLVSGVADDMAQAYQDWDEVWKHFPISIRDNSEDIAYYLKTTGATVKANTTGVGIDVAQGLIDGLYQKGSDAWRAAYDVGNQVIRGLKVGTDSHSPSKAAMKVGDFVGEGLAIGIENEEKDVAKAAREIGKVATENLTPYIEGFSLDGSLSSNLKDISSGVAAELAIENERTPIQLLLQIDGKDIPVDVDRIVDGINAANFLANRNLVNV